MKKLLVLLSFLLVLPSFSFGLIQPNKYQKAFIEEELARSVQELLLFWSLERYDEIYQKFSDRASKALISQDQFVSEMVKKNWIPFFDSKQARLGAVSFVGMSNVFVEKDVLFIDRGKPVVKNNKKLRFRMSYDSRNPNPWVFDIFVLLRANF